MEVGQVVRISGTGEELQKAHIHIVIGHNNENAYLVPISSVGYKWRVDKTCLLCASDGIPGITKNSFVFYGRSKIVRNDRSSEVLAQLSGELLSRIIAGVAKSSETPDHIRRAFVPPEAPRRVLAARED